MRSFKKKSITLITENIKNNNNKFTFNEYAKRTLICRLSGIVSSLSEHFRNRK